MTGNKAVILALFRVGKAGEASQLPVGMEALRRPVSILWL